MIVQGDGGAEGLGCRSSRSCLQRRPEPWAGPAGRTGPFPTLSGLLCQPCQLPSWGELLWTPPKPPAALGKVPRAPGRPLSEGGLAPPWGRQGPLRPAPRPAWRRAGSSLKSSPEGSGGRGAQGRGQDPRHGPPQRQGCSLQLPLHCGLCQCPFPEGETESSARPLILDGSCYILQHCGCPWFFNMHLRSTYCVSGVQNRSTSDGTDWGALRGVQAGLRVPLFEV